MNADKLAYDAHYAAIQARADAIFARARARAKSEYATAIERARDAARAEANAAIAKLDERYPAIVDQRERTRARRADCAALALAAMETAPLTAGEADAGIAAYIAARRAAATKIAVAS